MRSDERNLNLCLPDDGILVQAEESDVVSVLSHSEKLRMSQTPLNPVLMILVPLEVFIHEVDLFIIYTQVNYLKKL